MCPQPSGLSRFYYPLDQLGAYDEVGFDESNFGGGAIGILKGEGWVYVEFRSNVRAETALGFAVKKVRSISIVYTVSRSMTLPYFVDTGV
jgi:hypothetical protein